MQAKLLSPIISGIIGGILIPATYLILLWSANTIYPPDPNIVGNDGTEFSIFFIWALIIIPIILACTGALSLIIGYRYQLNRLDHIILPEISGIVAIVLGAILFLSTRISTISSDSIALWIGNINFQALMAGASIMVFLLVWAQCSLLGLIIYRLIFHRDLPDA